MATAMTTLCVAAVGGNALLRRGEPATIAAQRDNVRRAAESLAWLADGRSLVITHGNGPQVGLLAQQSETWAAVSHAANERTPFDLLVAESEGLVGALLVEELGRCLGPERVVALLTRVAVSRDDPAFDRPTKPIGAMFDEPTARRMAAESGWTIAADGDGWRRTVASPEPLAIVELSAVRALIDAGLVVVCTGGGGIPVARDDLGVLRGVEAVVDKDLASALLAVELDAHELLLLTDVDAVYTAWGTAQQRPIGRSSPPALRAEPWPAGSIGPKIEAACRFVEHTHRAARIGSLSDAAGLLAGTSGTQVTPT